MNAQTNALTNDLNAAAKAASKEAKRKASRKANDAVRAAAAEKAAAEKEAADKAAYDEFCAVEPTIESAAPSNESAAPSNESAAPTIESAAPSNESAAPSNESAAPTIESAETNRDKSVRMQALILESIKTRIDNAPSANFKKNMSAELSALSGRNALIAIERCIELEVDFEALAKQYAIFDSRAHDYVAIYAAQKIRKAVFALACGMTSVFDGYTVAILRNLVKLQALSNRGSQISLSNKVVFSEDMQTEAVRSFKMCEPSTASTQASSTRQMLRFMNICNVIKGRKDDSITLTDSSAAKKVQALFTV
jgi:hypothetical protein